GAGRVTEQERAARLMGQVGNGWWQVESLRRGHTCREGANRRSRAPAFVVKVDSEAPQAFNPVRGVGNHRFAVQPQGMLRERWKNGSFNFRAVQWTRPQFAYLALYPHAWRRAFHQ